MRGLLYQIPTWLQRCYRGVVWRKTPLCPHSDGAERGRVYLTFDDGPIPEVTPRVLEILRREGVKATFFMVGDNARKYPELLEQVRADGHRVGNHTMHHIKGFQTDTPAYMQDVQEADDLLQTRAFRPPYGRIRSAQKEALLRAGYTIYLWDVLTHDYNPRYTPERMIKIIRRYVRDGSIITFHDSLKSGDRMLLTLTEAIHWLRENGYEMDTL